jgi:isocitrate/isopropylmalate dehydrogenase
VGGLGLAPGANIGSNCAVFEAVHGSAPDIAGKGLANPTALLFSSLMMLRHIGENERASKIGRAVLKVCAEGKHVTGDLGGSATTKEFTDAIIREMNSV